MEQCLLLQPLDPLSATPTLLTSLRVKNGTTNITFNQTNNSPEALDAAEIYRNTKTQLAMAKDQLTV